MTKTQTKKHRKWMALSALMLLWAQPVHGDETWRDPTQPPAPARAVSAASPWKLEWLLIADSRRLAMINGHMVREGDTVRGARVAAIAPNEVRLIRGGRAIRLTPPHTALNVRQ